MEKSALSTHIRYHFDNVPPVAPKILTSTPSSNSTKDNFQDTGYATHSDTFETNSSLNESICSLGFKKSVASSLLPHPLGRYYGCRYFDIISGLRTFDKSGIILGIIFSLLCDEDFEVMKCVCTSWNNAIPKCSYLHKAIKLSKPQYEEGKENIQSVSCYKENKCNGRVLVSRQPYTGNNMLLENSNPIFELKPSVSEWWKVAENCVEREYLKPCPVCSGPAIRRQGTWPDQLICQRSECRAVVCSFCHSRHDPSNDCPSSILRNPSTGRVELCSETIGPVTRSSRIRLSSSEALKLQKKNRVLLKRL